MSVVVSRPEPEHDCGVNRWGVMRQPMANGRLDEIVSAMAGTVRKCRRCGRTWVAEWRTPGLAVSTWRREGWLERWWRVRRSRREVGDGN